MFTNENNMNIKLNDLLPSFLIEEIIDDTKDNNIIESEIKKDIGINNKYWANTVSKNKFNSEKKDMKNIQFNYGNNCPSIYIQEFNYCDKFSLIFNSGINLNENNFGGFKNSLENSEFQKINCDSTKNIIIIANSTDSSFIDDSLYHNYFSLRPLPKKTYSNRNAKYEIQQPPSVSVVVEKTSIKEIIAKFQNDLHEFIKTQKGSK